MRLWDTSLSHSPHHQYLPSGPQKLREQIWKNLTSRSAGPKHSTHRPKRVVSQSPDYIRPNSCWRFTVETTPMCLHPELRGFRQQSREDGNLTTASQEPFSKRLWGQIPGERLPILHIHTRFHTHTCTHIHIVLVELLVTQSCLFVTPWTVACQGPLSMGISRHEYWSG